MSRCWSTALARAAIRHGFPRFSYDDRPDELNEVTVRPLDAYGALACLRTRPDVDGATASACRAGRTAAAPRSPHGGARRALHPSTRTAFAAALAFYPACGLKHAVRRRATALRAGARVHGHRRRGGVAERVCATLVERSQARRGDIEITALSGRDPRLRRSRPQSPERRSQCQRKARRHRRRPAILRRAARGRDAVAWLPFGLHHSLVRHARA